MTGTVRARARCLVDSPALLLLVFAGFLSDQIGLPQATFFVAVGALFLGAWRLVRSLGRLRVADDAVLASWTLAIAWLALVAEVLSLAGLLGVTTGWLIGCLALYAASRVVAAPVHALDWRTPLAPMLALRLPGQLLFIAFLLPLVTLSVLVWFAGITNADSLLTYLSRAVRSLQLGTFAAYVGEFDYLQYLHTTVVAFPMLFLRTDVHANVLSMVSAGLASVALAAFCRSLGWGGVLPLVAAALPWTTPKLLLSAPTSAFDIFEGQWLVFALYFLRRGYPSTSVRWLSLAALATALGLAAKPTFYFAAPGLAALFALCVYRGVQRGRGVQRWRLRRVGALVGVGLLAGVFVGAPFLIRNVVVQGYVIAPAQDRDALAGQDGYATLTPADRLLALTINGMGMGLALMTPPYFLPESVNSQVNGWMHAATRALGGERFVAKWPELLRHGSERYHAGLAGFGGAVPLVLLPSVLLMPLAARRLGPRWMFPVWAVWLSASYLFLLALIIPIAPPTNRYLVEWLLLLSAIAPAALTVVPGRWRGVLACAVAVPLLFEMHNTLQNSRHVPLADVMRMSREEQTFTLFGWPTREMLIAVRSFEQRYPTNVVPTVYVVRRFKSEYLFSGPSLTRRLQGWTVPPRATADPITLPGMVLTENAGLVKMLEGQPTIVVERMASEIWLLHPLQALVVLTERVTAVSAGEPSVVVRAFAQRQEYPQPLFRFVVLRPGGGEEVLRDFAPDAQVTVPASAGPLGAMRMELRDAATGRTTQATVDVRR